MKLSDYVIKFLEEHGVKHVFLLSGGGMMHLLDSVANSKKIMYVCNHHEQASAMAAEGDQRVTGNIGVAMSTTGPGGTNMITGVMCAWQDSIPVIFISGQANSRSLIGNTGMRQRGVHEADIVTLVKSITKYAVTVMDKDQIKYHLEKALFLATHGRPGPIWLDIPVDIQTKDVNDRPNPAALGELVSFDPAREFPELLKLKEPPTAAAAKVAQLLKKSKRPLIVCGHGIRLAGAIDEFKRLVKKSKIPVVCAKNAYDILEYDNPQFLGMGGINGYRSANFALQGADLIISIGSRMAIPFTGYDAAAFAPHATKVVVDVDQAFLDHAHIHIDVRIKADAKAFIEELSRQMENGKMLEPERSGVKTPTKRSEQNEWKEWNEWDERCQHWKKAYPTVLPGYSKETRFVNAYYFSEFLFEKLDSHAIVVLDQGAAFFCPTQAAKIKEGQRMFTNGGISPMGYGLPAAIGACLGNGCKDVVCLNGDGGLELNIQELQTIVHYKLPIKLFVFSNEGYLSIKHTMKNFFGKYAACDPSCGVSIPSIGKIAGAYGIPFEKIANSEELRTKLPKILSTSGAMMIEVIMDPIQPFVPKVQSEKLPDGTMVSKPLDDMYPYLDRETYQKEICFVEPKTQAHQQTKMQNKDQDKKSEHLGGW